MADEPKSTSSSASTGKSAKSAGDPDPLLGGPTGNTIADTQGEYLTHDDPAQVPGTAEHLESDRPYEGGAPE